MASQLASAYMQRLADMLTEFSRRHESEEVRTNVAIFALLRILHIPMTPSDECLNRDGGLEIPGCWTAMMRWQGEKSWTAVMRRQGGRSDPYRPLTSNVVVHLQYSVWV